MKPLRISLPRRQVATIATLVVLIGSTMAAEAASSLRVRQVSARNLTRGFTAEALAANDLRPVERAFLAKAVETSRQQMRLAEIGVSQATRSEVRSHAQQLATDYRSLNTALEALVRRKGATAGAPVGGPSETYQKLVAQAGANFDREFVRAVARLTDDVLALFEQVASDAKDTEIRELAAAQLPVLRAHRSEVTELQKTID
jgi:predicted outer membrane protein